MDTVILSKNEFFSQVGEVTDSVGTSAVGSLDSKGDSNTNSGHHVGRDSLFTLASLSFFPEWVRTPGEDDSNDTKEVHMALSALTDTDFIRRCCATIVFMEVGPYVSTLNDHPYLQHGLLQDTPAAMKQFAVDTSFGFFGFTLGTLSHTIEAANRVENGETFREAHHHIILGIQKWLAERHSLQVPYDQLVAYFTLYMSHVRSIAHGPEKNRRLTGVERVAFKDASASELLESDERFRYVALLYRLWNGSLTGRGNKPKRLAEAYTYTFK
jgi:hypothetical protein